MKRLTQNNGAHRTRYTLKPGRVPSIIQMRLLRIVWLSTLGPQILPWYERLYGREIKRGTLYGTLSTLRERGWTTAIRDPRNGTMNQYRLTATGKQALAQAMVEYDNLLRNGRG